MASPLLKFQGFKNQEILGCERDVKGKQIGKEMESKAFVILQSDKYSNETKEFAEFILLLSNKTC